ncbi:MAG: acyltransferase [Gammaproteobacteria bacterium]|nr:acyltransferase [Gammaproteobacteria bacterium]
MPVTERIVQLDALRGIAAIGVIFFHAFRVQAFWMWSFVDLFFVLSGFLITDIILNGTRDTGRFLRNFWMRRILRIWPVYYVTLTGILLIYVCRALLAGLPLPTFDGTLRAFLFLQFTDQYFHSREVNEVVASFVPWFSHSWSLAVEEQFYVVWPLVVIALRRRRQPLVAVCLGMILTSIALREYGLAHYLLLTRLDGLALGSLLATLLHAPNGYDSSALSERLPLLFGGAAALGSALVGAYLVRGYSGALGTNPPDADYHCALVTAFSLVYFALTGWILTGRTGPVARVLAVRPLVYLGSLSYAIYMFHVPALYISHAVGRRLGLFGWEFWSLAAIPMIVLAAHLSRRWLEDPALRHKHRFPVRERGGAAIGGEVVELNAPPAPVLAPARDVDRDTATTSGRL